MDGPQWLGSAMRAARERLDLAAHNLANVSSDGFRKAVADVRLSARGLRVTAAPSPDQGGLRTTGRRFDLALAGPGAFHVGDGATRAGAFSRDRDGRLVDDRGRALHGTCGTLRLSANAVIDASGLIHDGGRIVDRLPLPAGTHVLAGALETSTVNPIDETLTILTAQRAFETAQKALGAIDATREKAADDVARLK